LTLPSFVAVLRVPAAAAFPAARAALLAAGASGVLSWPELAAGPDLDDDVPAVLVDPAEFESAETLAADLAVVLQALALHTAARPTAVIATTRPVIDTLKLVDAAGRLTGTAERDEHRFVGTPIAASLRLLRSVAQARPGPSGAVSPRPVEVLTALVDRGATVWSSSLQP